MLARARVMLASAALCAAFGPLASVHAQEVVPMPSLDSATQDALTRWRAAAISLAGPMSDAVAASYTGQNTSADAAAAKGQAEAAAWAGLDQTSQNLIQAYFAQVAASQALDVRDTGE